MDFRLYLMGQEKMDEDITQDILGNFDIEFDSKKI